MGYISIIQRQILGVKIVSSTTQTYPSRLLSTGIGRQVHILTLPTDKIHKWHLPKIFWLVPANLNYQQYSFI